MDSKMNYNLNEYDKLVICNGCRPSYISEHLPTALENALEPYFDEIFKKACDNHDICYYFGGDEKQRKRCDKRFYKAMKKSIKQKSHWYSRLWFYYKAWQYYRLVRRFGKASFNNPAKQLLPSQIPYLDDKIRKDGVECTWRKNRWWTQKEIENKKVLWFAWLALWQVSYFHN